MKLYFSPWTLFIRTALICFVLACVLFGISLERIERFPISAKPLEFEGSRAFQVMKTLSEDFPYRLPWNENKQRAADWLMGEFKKRGYSPKEMVFSETIEGKLYSDLRNLYVIKEGKTKPQEIIMAVAHYDTAEMTVQGAMDDASGVGIVLELARVFSKIDTDRTLLFLLTDSEEFGAFWGAHSFSKAFPDRDKIIAALNFDFVGPEDQEAILMLCDGLKSGYTPLWLREMALQSLRSIGTFEARDFMNVVEHVQRAITIPAADHGAFLQHGIPSFNWVGQTSNFAFQMAHYHHTPRDRVEIMKPKSFHEYGQAAERLIRSLDEFTNLPADFRDSNYWKITPNYYITGWVVRVLHILAFIPFLIYSLSYFGTALSSMRPQATKTFVFNELKNIAILFGSFLFGYMVLRLLPALKIITQYELFPATQKSVLLYNPNYLSMLVVGISVWIVYKVLASVFKEKADEEEVLVVRHAVHSCILLLVICFAFFKNSYLGTLLLLPPAYFWMGIRHRRVRHSKLINSLLWLGGALTLIILAAVFGTLFHIGSFYWYMFLASAYGLVSVYTVVLALMSITIMIRLFRSFFLAK